MKRIFRINGHYVEFCECTAIAASIGDDERQPALFIHDLGDFFRDGDGVIFGEDMPDSDADAASALESSCLDTDFETLETVIID